MTVISPTTELRSEQKKYLNLAGNSQTKGRTITDEDLKRGITADELLNRLRPRIKKLFDK